MAEFKTRFYNDWTGVEFALRWRSQDDYLDARRFLEDLLGGPASTIAGHDYFVLDDEQQFDALFAFRRELGYGGGISE
jgi:hypothetical protein